MGAGDYSEMSELNAKQRQFVIEYLKDKNCTQAAIRAGYSKKTAYMQGSRLLNKDEVRSKIREALDKVEKRQIISADEMLRELYRIAISDVRQAFNDDDTIKPPSQWPDDLGRAVSSIEVEELWEKDGQHKRQVGVVRKIKFWNKNHAVEVAMKHLGLLVEKRELSGKVTLEDIVAGPREKP